MGIPVELFYWTNHLCFRLFLRQFIGVFRNQACFLPKNTAVNRFTQSRGLSFADPTDQAQKPVDDTLGKQTDPLDDVRVAAVV